MSQEAKAMADDLFREFVRWRARKQREDAKYLESILKAWMA